PCPTRRVAATNGCLPVRTASNSRTPSRNACTTTPSLRHPSRQRSASTSRPGTPRTATATNASSLTSWPANARATSPNATGSLPAVSASCGGTCTPTGNAFTARWPAEPLVFVATAPHGLHTGHQPLQPAQSFPPVTPFQGECAMKVLYINNDGGGFADYIEVA